MSHPEIKKSSWYEEIEARRSSGMPVKEWCSYRGYSVSCYYYHQRMVRNDMSLQEQAQNMPTVRFAALPSYHPDGSALTSEEKREGEKVIIRCGAYLAEIPEGMSRRTILSIMEGMRC